MDTVNPISIQDANEVALDASTAEIEAAMAYERIFVPALFQVWSEHLISSASIRPGHRALDVACGTGVLARTLKEFTDSPPVPVGLDISTGMLAVARQIEPEIIWRQGDACALPFEDDSFENVFCQFGLMFFVDRGRAIGEMMRVLVPGGRLVLAVWDSLEGNPGFNEKIKILDRVAGLKAGDALRAPFCLGHREDIAQIMQNAGLPDVEITTIHGVAKFRNMSEFVDAEVRGWLPVMGVNLSEEVISAVHEECRKDLRQYEKVVEGTLTLPMSAHIVAAGR